MWRSALDDLEIARDIVEVISGGLGEDILLLDLSQITLIADYFVIATAETERQAKAISEALVTHLKREHGLVPVSVEGTSESGWVLLDYGAIVVHLFTPARRSHYKLEELWSQARTIVRMA